MPEARRETLPPPAAAPPDYLRPYTHHGVDLTLRGGHGVGTCPFCHRAGKFSVDSATGLWRCFVCGGGTQSGGGNAVTFLRLLHAASRAASGDEWRAAVARDRRFCGPSVVEAWGLARSAIPPHPWLVPGYRTDGTLDQLYKRVWFRGENGDGGGWVLLPTPGVWPEGKQHALYGAPDSWEGDKRNIVVCEGPWDGMALHEVDHEDLAIVAVPGCTTWRDEWTEWCGGKCVTLLYDSDHPRMVNNQSYRAGWDGMQRVARKLSGHAAEVRILRWGPEGFDPALNSGFDVRDALSASPLMVDRRVALRNLMGRVEEAPSEWFTAPFYVGGRATPANEARECSRFETCLEAWRGAIEMRQDLVDALSVLFAICASTNQAGNQLFMQLVGSAGSGKTTMCEGLLVSQHCHHLEHLKGFFSGFKKPGEPDKDCSLIARINGKTLITCEADVLMSDPRFDELMGQQRRIFDGKSGATYKNDDVDRLYVALRTPWILAGTQKMMDASVKHQVHLGDRFLRYIIDDPDQMSKRNILRAALRSERAAMLSQVNGTAGSVFDDKTQLAHALTGGYVDWLRANVEREIHQVGITDTAEDRCIDLAELCADLRARPNEDRRVLESHDSKELPTRLARQNVRLAAHLAVALNRHCVDADIMRVVRKVALNTAYGNSLNIAHWMLMRNPKDPAERSYQESGGITETALGTWARMGHERLDNYLGFLERIGVLESRRIHQGPLAWMLTERVFDLYLRVMRD